MSTRAILARRGGHVAQVTPGSRPRAVVLQGHCRRMRTHFTANMQDVGGGKERWRERVAAKLCATWPDKDGGMLGDLVGHCLWRVNRLACMPGNTSYETYAMSV